MKSYVLFQAYQSDVEDPVWEKVIDSFEVLGYLVSLCRDVEGLDFYIDIVEEDH